MHKRFIHIENCDIKHQREIAWRNFPFKSRLRQLMFNLILPNRHFEF